MSRDRARGDGRVESRTCGARYARTRLEPWRLRPGRDRCARRAAAECTSPEAAPRPVPRSRPPPRLRTTRFQLAAAGLSHNLTIEDQQQLTHTTLSNSKFSMGVGRLYFCNSLWREQAMVSLHAASVRSAILYVPPCHRSGLVWRFKKLLPTHP